MAKRFSDFLRALNGVFIIKETCLDAKMKEFRKELLSGKKFHPSQDKKNLRNDMQNIGRDLQKAFSEYKQIHG